MKQRSNSKFITLYCIMMALIIFFEGWAIINICNKKISIQKDMNPLSADGKQEADTSYSIYLNFGCTGNDQASIDYSNITDGYVSVLYKEETEKRLKVRVQGPETLYTYNLKQGEWTNFPLTDGNGKYTVTVYRNTMGTSYTSILQESFDVELANEVAPYLISSQYVNYEIGEETIRVAEELTANLDTDMEKFQAIYDFVIRYFTYDYDKARNVESGYIPNLDEVLYAGEGICFDYAALIAGMLRSQDIPCKLVVGYMDNAYHAWISVYVEISGEDEECYDNIHWLSLDPTVESATVRRNASSQITGAGGNSNYQPTYTEKYSY